MTCWRAVAAGDVCWADALAAVIRPLSPSAATAARHAKARGRSLLRTGAAPSLPEGLYRNNLPPSPGQDGRHDVTTASRARWQETRSVSAGP